MFPVLAAAVRGLVVCHVWSSESQERSPKSQFLEPVRFMHGHRENVRFRRGGFLNRQGTGRIPSVPFASSILSDAEEMPQRTAAGSIRFLDWERKIRMLLASDSRVERFQ